LGFLIAEVRPAIFKIFLNNFYFGKSENLESIAVDYPPAACADVQASIPWAEFGGHNRAELVTRIKALRLMGIATSTLPFIFRSLDNELGNILRMGK